VSDNPRFEEWLREVKRIAVEKYEFTRATAEMYFKFENVWCYFSVGKTPEEALIADREDGNG